MRVLHFFKTYYPDTFGGVERTIHAIAKGCTPLGIESHVLSLSSEPSKTSVTFDGHRAHKAKLDFELASTGFSFEVVGKFRKLSAQADIVHYHFPWPTMDIIHALYPPGKPTVVTYHSDIVKQASLLPLYSPLMHHFFSRVDRIIATSPNYLASSDILQRYRDKVEVIPIGLDQADYPRAPSHLTQVWKARFPRPFFLFVGVLRYYKGLHTLIEAAANIDADFLIAGTGPLEKELQQKASQCASNVYFLGAIDDLDKAALFELCTAFVFPSHLRSEAYGLSLVEAAMFGKPMISCEIGTGTSYVNRDRETGIVVPPEDSRALEGALRHMLFSNNTVRYAAAAHKRFTCELQASVMAQRYYSIYAQLQRAHKRFH